jgi:acyl-CoA reductase-like NAD-dependent aldehyde dehydrogenase
VLAGGDAADRFDHLGVGGSLGNVMWPRSAVRQCKENELGLRLELQLADMALLIDKGNVDRVENVVEAALPSAKPIVRGGPVSDAAPAAGAFYRPTLLEVDDVEPGIVQNEVFGPVATLEVFRHTVRRRSLTQ